MRSGWGEVGERERERECELHTLCSENAQNEICMDMENGICTDFSSVLLEVLQYLE